MYEYMVILIPTTEQLQAGVEPSVVVDWTPAPPNEDGTAKTFDETDWYARTNVPAGALDGGGSLQFEVRSSQLNEP